jgi:hypothetical protein
MSVTREGDGLYVLTNREFLKGQPLSRAAPDLSPLAGRG